MINMKTSIVNLNDALAAYLQKMRCVEKSFKMDYHDSLKELSSVEIKNEMKKYIVSCDENALRIERMHNYLMVEPVTGNSEVYKKLILETNEIIHATKEPHLISILFIGCLEAIIGYKISCYRTAYMIAVELELDTVTDLLEACLEKEVSARKAFSLLVISEFNGIGPFI